MSASGGVAAGAADEIDHVELFKARQHRGEAAGEQCVHGGRIPGPGAQFEFDPSVGAFAVAGAVRAAGAGENRAGGRAKQAQRALIQQPGVTAGEDVARRAVDFGQLAHCGGGQRKVEGFAGGGLEHPLPAGKGRFAARGISFAVLAVEAQGAHGQPAWSAFRWCGGGAGLHILSGIEAGLNGG